MTPRITLAVCLLLSLILRAAPQSSEYYQVGSRAIYDTFEEGQLFQTLAEVHKGPEAGTLRIQYTYRGLKQPRAAVHQTVLARGNELKLLGEKNSYGDAKYIPGIPLTKACRWQSTLNGSTEMTGETARDDNPVLVRTQSEMYPTLHVRRIVNLGDGTTAINEYYAPGIGLVKRTDEHGNWMRLREILKP